MNFKLKCPKTHSGILSTVMRLSGRSSYFMSENRSLVCGGRWGSGGKDDLLLHV